VADAEFKEFLLKYPDSILIPRVKRRLRQTQEVLAQGEYYTAKLLLHAWRLFGIAITLSGDYRQVPEFQRG